MRCPVLLSLTVAPLLFFFPCSTRWITGGAFADYFTVGCKTDGGLTVILIPRQEGVETAQMSTRYSKTAGTAYITFDNVKVPVENTLGPENGGLVSTVYFSFRWCVDAMADSGLAPVPPAGSRSRQFVILSNFNHERWVMCCSSARSSRMAVEECMLWAANRK